MTLLFVDGFDHYATADLTKKGYATVGTTTISSTYMRHTGQGISIASQSSYITRATGTTNDTLILGVAFYVDSESPLSFNASFPQITFLDEVTPHLSIYMHSAGFEVYGPGGSIGSVFSVYTNQSWNYLEVKVKINDTTGTVDLNLNDNNVLSISVVDTQATANSYITGVQVKGGYLTTPLRYDDLYLADTLGTLNNDFLGDVRVDTLHPDGAGNYSNWSPSAGSNYQNVDDPIAIDDDTTYNSTAVATTQDSYTLGDLPVLGTAIHGIQIATTARKDDAGTRTLQPQVRIGSTDYDIDSPVNVGDSYATILSIAEQNPDDAAAWEEADINGMEVGIELDA